MTVRFDPDQPRGPDGKWGDGMPSVIASVDLDLGGESGSMKALPGDKVRIALGGASADVPSSTGRDQIVRLMDQAGPGVREVTGADGKPVLRFRFGDYVETGEDDDGSPASVEFVGDGKTVGLTVAQLRSFVNSHERTSASTRFSALSGPVDTFLDGKTFAVRTKAGDGDPVTLAFNAKSWRKLMDAHQVVQEGYDDGGLFGPALADVNSLTVKTNAGDIVISRDSADDDATVTLAAAGRDDWAITHTLATSDPIHGAFERLADSADWLGFYTRDGGVMAPTFRTATRLGRTGGRRVIGFVDRSGLTDDSPLRVVMASEGRQADGIDLRMSGAQLDRYRANPVLGYGHSYWGRENLPIGRVNPASLTVRGTQLLGDLEFDQGDEFAREVERKMRAGYLNAVSVGFDVTAWENEADNYWRGGVATGWDLTELSVVPVPMDAAALVTSGRSLADPELLGALRDFSDADFDQLLSRLRSLREAVDGDLPTHIDPEPPAQEINPDAARSLLAAFAPKEN